MASYAYRAATLNGRVVTGREESLSASALEQELKRRGLRPLSVMLHGSDAVRRELFVSRSRDVCDFFTTLAALLQAGLSLERSLEVAGRGVGRQELITAVAGVRQKVREGGRLGDALAARPDLFPALAVGLLRAAEGGGQLAEAAARVAGYLERERSFRSRLASAMVYPAVLGTAGTGAIAVLILFVLPRFATLLAEAGSALPASTAMVIAAAGLLSRGFPVFITLLLLAGAGFLSWRATPAGRVQLHAFLLAVPVIGGLRARHGCARLAYTLSTLLSGGVPLLQALRTAQDSVNDAAIAADLVKAQNAVRRGDSFSAALARGRGFPDAFLRLVELGEETGQLDTVLARAAALLEGELQRRLERLLALLEPVLIMVFGAAVGFVALALLQAVYGIHAQGL